MRAIDEARRLVRSTDVDALRDDDNTRKHIATEAKNILNAIQF